MAEEKWMAMDQAKKSVGESVGRSNERKDRDQSYWNRDNMKAKDSRLHGEEL